jgi:hypothetical protein
MSDFQFSADEVQNIVNAVFDHHIKGPAISQAIKEKPLYDALRRRQKKFSGGKGYIKLNVKGSYTTTIQGYKGDDAVTYRNPANIRQAEFPWKELHAGIQITHTELKHDGISVNDDDGTNEHSDVALTRITGLLDDKLEDMDEGWAQDFDLMLHGDGTDDPDKVPGIFALITEDPSTGLVGGIDRAANTWWRNRSRIAGVGDGAITHSAANQTLTKTLRSEVRQLSKFVGGKPNLILCGSGFLEKLETEVHEKGTYTQAGFVNKGKTDIGLPAISMYGVGDFHYDPTLDEVGYSNRAYFIDDKSICLYVMEGEDMKACMPKRPHDRYVHYRAMTWTGGLIARRLNSSGVYEAA